MHLCLAAIAYLNRSENMNSKIGIDMDSLWELGRDLTEVRSALRYYQDKHVLLLFDGKEIEPLFLQQFLEHVLSLQKEKLKSASVRGLIWRCRGSMRGLVRMADRKRSCQMALMSELKIVLKKIIH